MKTGTTYRIARPVYTVGGAPTFRVGDLVRLDKLAHGLALVTDHAGHLAQIPATALATDTPLTLPTMTEDTGTGGLFD